MNIVYPYDSEEIAVAATAGYPPDWAQQLNDVWVTKTSGDQPFYSEFVACHKGEESWKSGTSMRQRSS
jgi:hypothetical protein